MLRFLSLSLAFLFLSSASPQGSVQHVDFYGLRNLDRAEVQAVLGLEQGASTDFDGETLENKLRAIDGIVDATIMRMMVVNQSDAIVLVGILEEGVPVPSLRATPKGVVRLPESFHLAYTGLMEEGMNGFEKGIGGSDRSQGHPISRYAPARAYEEEILRLVPKHLPLLREVLRTAADSGERLVAAHAIAYAPDKQSIVGDLAFGMTDPDASVRNNSVRALGVLVEWSQNGGQELSFDIDFRPLITMLESINWTDRNKAAALLQRLSLDRPEDLMEALRAKSLKALEEMALWHSTGHAFFSVTILARLADLSNEEIAQRSKEVRASGFGARVAWVRELVELASEVR